MTDLVYFNVNEEAEPYAATTSLEEAQATLAEFPNDTIITVVKGSPIFNVLAEALGAEALEVV